MTNKGTFLVRIKRKKKVHVAKNVIIKIDLTILS